MDSKIVKFKYEEGDIKIDVPFNGNIYINATEVYQAFGKKQNTFSEFLKNKLNIYAQKLIESGRFNDINKTDDDDYQVVINDVIVKKIGGNVDEQGTWLHPELGLVFARWLSIDFEIWCDDKLKELLKTDITSPIVEPKEEQKALPSVNDYYEEMIACYRKKRTSSHVHVARPMKKFLSMVNTNTSEFTDYIKSASKTVGTPFRIEFYDKIKDETGTMVANGELNLHIRADMMNKLDKYYRHTTARRITTTTKERDAALVKADKALKKADKLEVEVKDLSVENIEKQGKIDEIIARVAQNSVSRIKLNLGPKNPIRDVAVASRVIKESEGHEVIFAGTVSELKPTAKPDYSGMLGGISVVIYMNRDQPRSFPNLSVSKVVGTTYDVIVKSMTLKDLEHLQYGVKVLGNDTYFAAFEPNSGALIVYKQINNA